MGLLEKHKNTHKFRFDFMKGMWQNTSATTQLYCAPGICKLTPYCWEQN